MSKEQEPPLHIVAGKDLKLVINKGPLSLGRAETTKREINQYHAARHIIRYQVEQPVYEATKTVIERIADKYPEQLAENYMDFLESSEGYEKK